MKKYDVVIIGGGVIGAMIAKELSRYAISVCVLEKASDVATGATKANSGIVHAGYDAMPGTLKAKLNSAGSKSAERVCGQLGVKYKNNGSLVLAFSQEEMSAVEKLYERGLKNGIEGLSVVDGDRVRELEPNLSKEICGALLAETAGIVCPYELCIAAMGNAMDNGAELRLGYEAREIYKDAGEFWVNGEIAARFVVNCAGLYADTVAAMIGDRSFRITPRRGEYILLDREKVPFTSHTVFNVPGKMGKGILITPTVDNNYLLGPTSVDIADKEDKSTTPEGLAAVALGAYRDSAEISLKNRITSFCGLRAVGSTGDFIISPSVQDGCFVNVAGMESPGLTSSFAVGDYVARILQNAGLPLRLKEKAIEIRQSDFYYRELSPKEKNKIIQKDKRYGKIVCRCEGVTEGEIVRAIHRNPPAYTLDAVKRRTRSGMGRCQGGFCGTQITAILARETAREITEITKSEKGSELNFYKLKQGE